ncbi:hypothetical protein [Microbacterium sp.]
MRHLLILALFTSSVFACSSPAVSPEETFDEENRLYHGHLRWARYHEAASFIEIADREEFLGYYDELGDDYEVTDFEIEGVSYDPEAHTAVVTVAIESFRLPSTRVHTETIEETWEYNQDTRHWQIVEWVVEND